MTWATGAAVAVRHERRRHEKRPSAACPRPTELNLPTSPMSYSSSPILPQTSPSGPIEIPEIYVCKLPLLQIIVVSLVLGAILLIVGLVQLKPGAGASQHKFLLLGSGIFLLIFGIILAFTRCCLLPWSVKQKRRKLLMDDETALQNGKSRTRTPSHTSLQTPNHIINRATPTSTYNTSINNVIAIQQHSAHHIIKPHSNHHHHIQHHHHHIDKNNHKTNEHNIIITNIPTTVIEEINEKNNNNINTEENNIHITLETVVENNNKEIIIDNDNGNDTKVKNINIEPVNIKQGENKLNQIIIIETDNTTAHDRINNENNQIIIEHDKLNETTHERIEHDKTIVENKNIIKVETNHGIKENSTACAAV